MISRDFFQSLDYISAKRGCQWAWETQCCLAARGVLPEISIQMKLRNFKVTPLILFPLNTPPLLRFLSENFFRLLRSVFLVPSNFSSFPVDFAEEFRGEAVESRVGLYWEFGPGRVVKMVGCLPSAVSLHGSGDRPNWGQQGNKERQHKIWVSGGLGFCWRNSNTPEAQSVYSIQLSKESADTAFY